MTVWAKIIESAVVYIHVFANATELDLLHVPDIQNRRSRRHAKKCSRWHVPTMLSELGKYIYVPTAAIIWTWCIGCILFLNIMLMGPHCWELVAYLVCLTWQYASILASGLWSAISYLASKLGSLARKIGATYQIIHRMYIALVPKSDQYGQNFFLRLTHLGSKVYINFLIGFVHPIAEYGIDCGKIFWIWVLKISGGENFSGENFRKFSKISPTQVFT